MSNEAEAITALIDRQANGIVGPLRRLYPLHREGEIRPFGIDGLLYMPKVEKRGKQRRPGGTALQRCANGKRSMFMHKKLDEQSRGSSARRFQHCRCSSTSTRTGKELIKGPMTRSAASPPFIRPKSTVPKTTSLPVGGSRQGPAPKRGGKDWQG